MRIIKSDGRCDKYYGVSIERNIKEWQRLIGYPARYFLIDDDIKRNIAFGEIDSEIDHNKIASAINEAQLSDLLIVTKRINTRLGERGRLSGGRNRGLVHACTIETLRYSFLMKQRAHDNQTELNSHKKAKGKGQ